MPEGFDVFLCYNRQDKKTVTAIGRRLKARGLRPWLDEWELPPGLNWQKELEKQIKEIGAAAVFVGRKGLGPWQEQEIDGILRVFVQRGCPVIPVLLEDCPEPPPALPIFLTGRTWVDFREQDSDPLGRLQWGITGKRVGEPAGEIAAQVLSPDSQ
ncbi:MAG: toll/interleukin-1 receptor domain-containing protein, partial [Thermoanaerobaculia bacterium]